MEEKNLEIGQIRYSSLNGLKTYAALGIIAMHIKANSNYTISGFFYGKVISFFTNFVFLFMIISAFGMCCGYYERVKSNGISIGDFYKKRYLKIWPFFAVLVLLDFIMNPSFDSFLESFADLTLLFGFLPNANISVIGVGWFLGVVFVFYIIFPFYVFLIGDKKRAWMTLVLSCIFNYCCTSYFFNKNHVTDSFNPRTNILFIFMFFVAGGLIYLYREQVVKLKRYNAIILMLAFVLSVSYFVRPPMFQNEVISNFIMLLMFSMWLIYSIICDNRFLDNVFTKFVSSISMEIYLCHMISFRVIEKLNINYFLGTGWVSYIFVFILTTVGAIVLSLCINKGLFFLKGNAINKLKKTRR